MKKSLLFCAVSLAGTAMATPFTGNDAESSAMGNTGVASASPQNAFQFNPGLLADYPDNVDFGLTLPAIKFFVDDSNGFIDSASAFTDEGGTWDQFQTVDATALQDAVTNITPTLDAIAGAGGDLEQIQQAVTDLENATTEAQAQAAIDDLNTASASLSTNADTLDSDTTTVNVQMSNLNGTATSAQNDLEGFTDKPVQLGLGIDLLNVAIPSERLGMALSLSTSSTVGTSFRIASEDLDPVINLSADLTGFTAESTALTTAVSDLADANAELTAHFNDRPNPEDDPAAYSVWTDELEVRRQAVEDAATDVQTAQTNLQTYNGANGTITNGEITIGTIEDPQSEIDIVGANISEVGVTVARKFVIQGEEVAVGVTPKFQSINVFEKTIAFSTYEDELDSASSDPVGYLTENTTMLYRVNLDVGVAKTWDFYGRARAGLAVKDLIPWTLESDSGTELLIRPKLRIGGAHETKFTKLALDLDLTENKPLKYGVPTRYLGLGAEVNAWGHAALRVGYRNNLSVEDSHVLTGGIGLTPFGTGLDISAWAKPASFDDWTTIIQDAGASVQFSVNF